MNSNPHPPIVITGATRGLGRALAHAYDRAGHRVACCGRQAETVTALRQELSLNAQVSVVDVAEAESVNAWAAKIIERSAPCLVCHCAGTLPPRRPFAEVPPESFEAALQTHIVGSANIARAFLPTLLSAGRGILAVMASNPDGYPLRNLSVYAVCKTAVERLWQAMAAEANGTNVAVVAIYPGLVRTDMLRESLGKEAEAYPKPDTWAKKAAPFILSLGPEVNGQHLSIQS